MKNRFDHELSAQEFHNKQFKEFVKEELDRKIRIATYSNDFKQVEYLQNKLEQIDAGNLSVASDMILVVSSGKLYYSKEKERVVLELFPYN